MKSFRNRSNDKDPVLFLTTPRNAVNQTVKVITGKDINSPIYIPNLIVDIPLGIWNAAFHSDQHGVDDKNYSKYLSGNYKWGPQNSSNISNQTNQ